jgi:hypothetical protein
MALKSNTMVPKLEWFGGVVEVLKLKKQNSYYKLFKISFLAFWFIS